MKKILVLSDTHSFIDDRIINYASKVDFVIHAGDIGNFDVIKKEADLSIRQLEEIPKDSNAQMNKFVEQYNLDI